MTHAWRALVGVIRAPRKQIANGKKRNWIKKDDQHHYDTLPGNITNSPHSRHTRTHAYLHPPQVFVSWEEYAYISQGPVYAESNRAASRRDNAGNDDAGGYGHPSKGARAHR